VRAARRDGDDLVLELRIQPRASATGFGGRFADRLRVRLNAPPVDGRANAALIDYLSDSCGVAKSQVVIEQGLAGRDKRVRIRGAQRIPSAVQEALDYS
jgi:uncharacterized protein (TIGR00251 family)